MFHYPNSGITLSGETGSLPGTTRVQHFDDLGCHSFWADIVLHQPISDFPYNSILDGVSLHHTYQLFACAVTIPLWGENLLLVCLCVLSFYKHTHVHVLALFLI